MSDLKVVGKTDFQQTKKDLELKVKKLIIRTPSINLDAVELVYCDSDQVRKTVMDFMSGILDEGHAVQSLTLQIVDIINTDDRIF